MVTDEDGLFTFTLDAPPTEPIELRFEVESGNGWAPTIPTDGMHEVTCTSEGCPPDMLLFGVHGGTSSTASEPSGFPTEYVLQSAYPNPFNPSTTIRFSLPEGTDVQLRVFAMLGREVARLVDGPVDAGNHIARFEAGGLPSGTYFYQLVTSEFSESRRMMLVK